MLKWLVTVAGREGEVETGPAVTEDPLATLNIKKYKKREQIYSVNRWVVWWLTLTGQQGLISYWLK